MSIVVIACVIVGTIAAQPVLAAYRMLARV